MSQIFESSFPNGTRVKAHVDFSAIEEGALPSDYICIEFEGPKRAGDFHYYQSWVLGIVSEAAKRAGRPLNWYFAGGNGNKKTSIWRCLPDGTRKLL